MWWCFIDRSLLRSSRAGTNHRRRLGLRLRGQILRLARVSFAVGGANSLRVPLWLAKMPSRTLKGSNVVGSRVATGREGGISRQQLDRAENAFKVGKQGADHATSEATDLSVVPCPLSKRGLCPTPAADPANSGGSTLIVMMEAADFRETHDLARFRHLNLSGLGSLFV
jgi:hypothetical protein